MCMRRDFFESATANNPHNCLVSRVYLGELTLEEFISGAREHEDIMEMLTKMMDLTHVLEIIVKGQKSKN